MGVYIGMEMPKSCSDCPMLDWDLDYIKCKVTGRHFKVKEEPFGARRVDDCPLISVPEPHGRLGDLDALNKKAVDRSEKLGALVNVLDKVLCSYDIQTAPTIIPASERE